MYLSSAPALASEVRTGPARAPLRVARAERRVFPDGEPYTGDAALEEYLTDMAELYGLSFRGDLFAAGNRNGYTRMAKETVHSLFLEEPIDLVVVAHATPDADPTCSPACYLTEHAPGEALAFAISDQGVLAPFTAVRLISDYARDLGAHRALLLVTDQTTLPYEVAADDQLIPQHDSAVAVLLEHSATDEVAVHQRCAVDPTSVPEAVSTVVSEVETPTSVLVGPGVDAEAIAWMPETAEVQRGPEGMPASGVWAALADNPARSADTGRRIVLADYDRSQGDLGICVFEGTRT